MEITNSHAWISLFSYNTVLCFTPSYSTSHCLSCSAFIVLFILYLHTVSIFCLELLHLSGSLSGTTVLMRLRAKQVWGPVQVITFALLKLLALINCLSLSLSLPHQLFSLHLLSISKSPCSIFYFYINSLKTSCQLLTVLCSLSLHLSFPYTYSTSLFCLSVFCNYVSLFLYFISLCLAVWIMFAHPHYFVYLYTSRSLRPSTYKLLLVWNKKFVVVVCMTHHF